MKLLIKAHVITAILGWIFILVIGFLVVKDEGSLPAVLSLCLMGIATFITVVDVSSVFLAKKNKAGYCLAIISTAFWGLVIIFYGIVLFSPDQAWQSRVVLGVLIAVALFKVIASVLLMKETL
jgi:hypothetical protein